MKGSPPRRSTISRALYSMCSIMFSSPHPWFQYATTDHMPVLDQYRLASLPSTSPIPCVSSFSLTAPLSNAHSSLFPLPHYHAFHPNLPCIHHSHMTNIPTSKTPSTESHQRNAHQHEQDTCTLTSSLNSISPDLSGTAAQTSVRVETHPPLFPGFKLGQDKWHNEAITGGGHEAGCGRWEMNFERRGGRGLKGRL